MKMTKKMNRQGFTLIELLMVILLIAILATIGITQFVNYGADAKNAATRANVTILRDAISNMRGLLSVRCKNLIASNYYPTRAAIVANNATADLNGCTTVTGGDLKFVAGTIPPNPWGTAASNGIVAVTTPGSTPGTACNGVAFSGDGWCYDVSNGNIWADSQNNPTTNESSY